MTQEEKVAMLKKAGVWDVIGFPSCIDKLFELVAAHERATYRLPKMTEEQIWKCNHDGDGGYHICVEHQNVVDFARAIEREIGFDRANMWLKRIKDAIAAEREACAKVCEEKRIQMNYSEAPYNQCAAAIRARGEK